MGYKIPDDESIEEYLRYASHSRGVPEEFDDWAVDNGIKLSKSKKKDKDYEDEQ
jgi:hypothetical protein